MSTARALFSFLCLFLTLITVVTSSDHLSPARTSCGSQRFHTRNVSVRDRGVELAKTEERPLPPLPSRVLQVFFLIGPLRVGSDGHVPTLSSFRLCSASQCAMTLLPSSFSQCFWDALFGEIKKRTNLFLSSASQERRLTTEAGGLAGTQCSG